MVLELESGRRIHEATEADILASLGCEDFAILAADEMTYMQCAVHSEPPQGYHVEYQEGSLDEHYQAVDHPISLDRVTSAFIKYLRGDPSWRDDFRWKKMDLPS